MYNSKKIILISPNFPQTLSHQIDCTFNIQKTHHNICKLKLQFLYFWLGPTDHNACPYGFLSLDGKHFCGCNTNLKISTKFDQTGVKRIALKTFGYQKHNIAYRTGFIIEVTQEECIETDKKLPSEDIGNNHNRSSNKIVFPGAQIEKLNLIGQKTELLNQQKFNSSTQGVVKNVYFFAEENDDDPFSFPKPNQENLYSDTSYLESITANDENFSCTNKLTPRLLEFYKSSIGVCRKKQKSENIFSFKKHFSIKPPVRCVEFKYIRGYFKSPWYPFFYQRNLNICYR